MAKPIGPYEVEVVPELEGIAESAGVETPDGAQGGPQRRRGRGGLRDHDGFPEAVSAHEDPTLPPVEDYVTVDSWVADTGRGTARVTDGNPCERPYASYSLEALIGASPAPSLESGASLG